MLPLAQCACIRYAMQSDSALPLSTIYANKPIIISRPNRSTSLLLWRIGYLKIKRTNRGFQKEKLQFWFFICIFCFCSFYIVLWYVNICCTCACSLYLPLEVVQCEYGTRTSHSDQFQCYDVCVVGIVRIWGSIIWTQSKTALATDERLPTSQLAHE